MSDRRREAPLDWLNFFLSDVRDGLGPYLAIYLLTVQHWNEASIGLVMSIAGIAAIIAQTPAGAWIDRSRRKRAIVIAAAAVVTVTSVLLPVLPEFTAVAITQALSGAAGSVFQPAIAAITLGIFGPRAFTRRTGRNEAFNHAGNVMAALLAGGLATWFGPVAVFYTLSAMALASIVAVLVIPTDSIDNDMANGLKADSADTADAAQAAANQTLPGSPAVSASAAFPATPSPRTVTLRDLMSQRALLVFAACVTLFHFANAAMLPLVGQKLARVRPDLATALMSGCIIAAQLVMVPVAMLVGAKADVWGRKPLLTAGFLVLVLRGVLYVCSDNPVWLVAVQALDGVGAGIFGAVFPLIVADLTRGTGRFNLAQGAVTTSLSIGAALSTAIAGWIVVTWSYSGAFLFLAGVALVGLTLFRLAMPETLRSARVNNPADLDKGSRGFTSRPT